MANTVLLVVGAINANLNTSERFASEAVQKNIGIFNGALVVCVIMGPFSYALFWFQRKGEEPLEPPEATSQDKKIKQYEEKRPFEQVLEDIKLGKRPNVNVIVRLADVILLLLDYPILLIHVPSIIRGDDPIWKTLLLLFAFFPGFAWHSHSNLVGSQNRFSWFLSSLFFPGFVAWTRVGLSFYHSLMFFSSV